MIKVTYSDEDGVDSSNFKTQSEVESFIGLNVKRCESQNLKQFSVLSIEGEPEI